MYQEKSGAIYCYLQEAIATELTVTLRSKEEVREDMCVWEGIRLKTLLLMQSACKNYVQAKTMKLFAS